MTAPAIPEHLDELVYDLMLKRKPGQWISDHLWEVHRVKASRSAVASCFERVKKEKLGRIFELTDDARGLDGGGLTLDRLFRESQALALEAVEGHQLAVGLRAIDQQLRILKLHQAQLRAEAAAEKEAGSADPANTLQRSSAPKDLQGVSAILQGAEKHPAAPDAEVPAPPAMAAPATQAPSHDEPQIPLAAISPAPSVDAKKVGGDGARHGESDPAAVASPPSHEPQRNKPCPCGSGRKYKKCCRLKALDESHALPFMADQSPRFLSRPPTNGPPLSCPAVRAAEV